MPRNFTRVRFSLFVLVSCCFLSALAGQEGGIEVFAGETIFGSGMRASVTQISKRDVLHAGGREISTTAMDEWIEERSVLGFDYGLRPDLQLSILVPYVDRELRVAGMRFQESGFGDAAALAKYRLYKRDWHQGSLNIAFIAGAEAPTGKTDARTNGLLNPLRAQLGSGSWDPFAALSINLGTGVSRFDALFIYKDNQEGARRTAESDFFVAQLTAAHRFINEPYPGPTVGVAAGLAFQHRSRSEIAGVRVRNSGSDLVLLHLGLSVHPVPSVDLGVSVDVPVYDHYNGTQLGRELFVSVAFGYRF